MKINCQECNTEFEPINNRGNEQKYCSVKCRSKAGSKRYIQKVINSNNINNTNGLQGNGLTESMDSSKRGISEIEQRGRNYSDIDVPSNKEPRYNEWDNSRYTINGVQESHINLIKELYESRTESVFYKLKCENLEKEINKLRIENAELESELDDIDNDSDESSNQFAGMLGGVMEQFKTDPVNTINFATELIGTLLKPNKNETTVKS